MRTLDNLQDWLTWDEGLRLSLYVDTVGNWTGGIGHNFTANGLKSGLIGSIPDGNWIEIQRQGLALSEALDIYTDDVAQAQAALTQAGILGMVSDPRYCALVNMMFNLGSGTFAKFTTFSSLIKTQQWTQAAADLRQNPKLFIGGLAPRYNRIAAVLEADTWPIIP